MKMVKRHTGPGVLDWQWVPDPNDLPAETIEEIDARLRAHWRAVDRQFDAQIDEAKSVEEKQSIAIDYARTFGGRDA